MPKEQLNWVAITQDEDGTFHRTPIGAHPSVEFAQDLHPRALILRDGGDESDSDALIHLLVTQKPISRCQHSPRTFHRRLAIHEALSEEPFNGMCLDDVLTECRTGHMSGCNLREIHSTMDGAEAAKALAGQGSDPGFFNLDSDGNPTEEEE